MVVNSEGLKAEDLQPRDYLTALVVAEKNGKREQAGWNLGGRQNFSFFSQNAIDAIAGKAVNDALLLFDAVQPPAGEMPVVFAPGVTAILLHEAIGHGMEADFNRKKTSTYCTMIGKKVAEPFITIIDDGTIPNLLGSINFDDEGTPGQRTVLVENGILKSYMHDKISARHLQGEAHWERPSRELPALCAAAHAQHDHAGRPGHAAKKSSAAPRKASMSKMSATARSTSAKAISLSMFHRAG